MIQLTNLRNFQQNDSSNFVLFTESQHCSVQLLPPARNWVFVNKPSKKLLQNCKVRKFVTTKMKNGHSWGDYNFLLFFTDLSTSSTTFFANVETNPQIMSSNQVGKTLTVTDNLRSTVWEMAKSKVWDSFQQLYLFSLLPCDQMSSILSLFTHFLSMQELETILKHGSLTMKMWLRLFLKLKGVELHDLLMNASLFVLSISLLSFCQRSKR